MKLRYVTHKSIICLLTLSILGGCSKAEALREDEEMLAEFLKKHQPQIDQCFSRSNNLSTGKTQIQLEAQHQPDGSFTRIIGQAGPEDVVKCAIENLKSWKTRPPKVPGPVELSWNFHLKEATQIHAEDLSRFQNDFDFCFKHAKNEDPNLMGGLMRIQLRISEDGQVESIQELTGFRGSDSILNCLSKRSHNWQFSTSGNSLTQVWTWNFESKF